VKVFWLTGLVSLCLLGCAQAATPTAEVHLKGPTDAAMQRRLEEGVRRGLTVYTIDSGGGRERDALKIAKLIERHGVDLIVDGRCTSACAQYLLPAARTAVVKPGSIIAVHLNSYGLLQVRGLDTGRIHNLQELLHNAHEAERLYRRQAVNPSLLVQATSALRPQCVAYTGSGGRLFGHFDFWVPSREHLERAGLTIEGPWPNEEAEYRRLIARYYSNPARIRYGDIPEEPQAPVRECRPNVNGRR